MSPLSTRCGLAGLLTALAACGQSGGGGGDGGTVPTLSSAQANYESGALAVNGGLHNLLWSFHPAAAPAQAAGDFLVDITSGGLAKSPLTNGAQRESAGYASLSASLSVPSLPLNLDNPSGSPATTSTVGPTVRLPSMVVQGGSVIVVSAEPTYQEVSYVGGDIQIDVLATDQKTVAFGTTVSAVSPVAVVGESVAAPSDVTIAGWLGKDELLANATLVKAEATFEPGAEYFLFTATRSSDTLFTGDCTFNETSVAPPLVPCQTGAGIGSTGHTSETNFSDGSGGAPRTWTFATDGTVCEIASQETTSCPSFGVRYWVASAPRTASMNVPAETQSYRVYYEMNGNLYSGELQRAGAALGENIGTDAKPNVLPSYLRVNSAFVASLKAALTF